MSSIVLTCCVNVLCFEVAQRAYVASRKISVYARLSVRSFTEIHEIHEAQAPTIAGSPLTKAAMTVLPHPEDLLWRAFEFRADTGKWGPTDQWPSLTKPCDSEGTAALCEMCFVQLHCRQHSLAESLCGMSTSVTLRQCVTARVYLGVVLVKDLLRSQYISSQVVIEQSAKG